MEPKCNYCDFFGEKYHCHNCKIFNKSRTHTPQEIDCSLEELVEYISNNEDISERFGIGDYKDIELYTGEVVRIILIGQNHDNLANGSGQAKTTFGVFHLEGSYQMNDNDTNEGSWRDCKMRKMMERIYRILPTVLRDNIKPVTKKTSAGNRSTEIVCTEDKVFCFSEVELLGSRSYSAAGEGEQYEYFSFEQNRRFKRYLWLRSPRYISSNCFCYVGGSGYAGYVLASVSTGVAFGFSI